MKHTLLLGLLLFAVPAIHGMEIGEITTKNEQVYQLFTTNQQSQAEKISYKQHELTSLFVYGAEQNNEKFMLWLLTTKKPSPHAHCVQEAFKLKTTPAVTYLLADYMLQGRNQPELHTYTQTQLANLNKNAEDDECHCIIS